MPLECGCGKSQCRQVRCRCHTRGRRRRAGPWLCELLLRASLLPRLCGWVSLHTVHSPYLCDIRLTRSKETIRTQTRSRRTLLPTSARSPERRLMSASGETPRTTHYTTPPSMSPSTGRTAPTTRTSLQASCSARPSLSPTTNGTTSSSRMVST